MSARPRRGRPPGPRIRTLKPEVHQHERIGRLSDKARLLFFGLVTLADDEGRFRALPSVVLGHVFPYDAAVTPARLAKLLAEVEASGTLLLYAVDGVPYGAFRNWRDHQRIDKPTPSELPPPPDAAVAARNRADGERGDFLRERSASAPGALPLPRAGARSGPDPDPVPDPAPVAAPSPARDGAAEERLWAHYVATFGAEGRRFDETRRAIVRAALAVRPLDTCVAAVTGLSRSPFHAGANREGRRWEDLRHALRGNRARGETDEERIDRMAALAAGPAPGGRGQAYAGDLGRFRAIPAQGGRHADAAA